MMIQVHLINSMNFIIIDTKAGHYDIPLVKVSFSKLEEMFSVNSCGYFSL